MNILAIICGIHGVIFISAHLVLICGLIKESRLKAVSSEQWAVSSTPSGSKPSAIEDSNVSTDKPDKKLSTAHCPLPTAPPTTVSIIIPARNEAGRLGGLLESLGRQTYPNIEYVFINDRSTDDTQAMLEEFSAKMRERGQRSVILNLSENTGPNYKQYALIEGIEQASGNFLLFTDADCAVSPVWVETMIRLMLDDPRRGVIIAPVFKKSIGASFLSTYQCLDHAVRCVYLVGTTGFGAGFCGFGNNMALRKAALDEAGGYRSVPWSLTEDAALISHIRAKTHYTVEAAPLPGLFVLTESEPSWQALTNQTLRWNNGALWSRDLRTRFSYNYLMYTVLIGLLAIPAGLFWKPAFLFAAAGPFLVIVLMNICALVLFGKTLPKSRFAYIAEILLMPFYFSYLTIMGAFGIIPAWKGNKIQGGKLSKQKSIPQK